MRSMMYKVPCTKYDIRSSIYDIRSMKYAALHISVLKFSTCVYYTVYALS